MSAVVPGLGFTRLRGVLLMLGEAVGVRWDVANRQGVRAPIQGARKVREPCRRTDQGEHPASA